MQKAQRSTFARGLNSDLDKSITPNENFIEAYNLHLAGDGKFTALENLSGTTELFTLDATFTGTVIGGPYSVQAKIDGVSEPCLLVFTLEGTTNAVTLYRINSAAATVIYTETYSGSETLLVDGVVYPENGVDIVYYTDGGNELRKLRLEFTSPIPAFTAQQISLQRRAPLFNTRYTHATGGSLLTGSYQFSARFYNNVTKAYSKWSIPSTPRIVSLSGTLPTGYYGMGSDQKITVNITGIPTSEQSVWTHTQVAVIENISEVRPVTAALQPIQTISGSTSTYEYKGNDNIGTISLTDIVVDQAAIEYVKTLAVKNNRIFGGNIKYKPLSYDRNPTVTGSIITEATAQTYSDQRASDYKGHWRDEVYRYYAVYWDDKYNFYRPYKLNMSAVTTNQTANGDLKYPARNLTGGLFTLMDGSDNFLQLGLNLTVNNHPSGARGVAIYRAKRKKQKLFQTPLIPSVEVQGINTIGEYPNIAQESPVSGGSATVKEYPTATPMNAAGTLIPANLFHTSQRHFVKRIATDTTTAKNQAGEVYYLTSGFYTGDASSVFFAYDPAQLYANNPYTFTGSERYKVIDFAYLRLDYTAGSKPDASYSHFDYLDTSVHGTFYANRNSDYFQRYTTVGVAPGVTNSLDGEIVNAAGLTAYGEGTTLGGSFVGNYQNLSTGGISYGQPANNQLTTAIQLSKSINDSTLRANTQYAGQIPATFFKTAGFGGATALSILNTADNTTFLENGSFAENNTLVNSIEIADIELDLDDDRYGASDTIHELEFTGASHTFSDADVATVVSSGVVPVNFTKVFGGDCWVSMHSFKLTDSHYSMINTRKFIDPTGVFNADSQDDLIKKWTRFFLNKTGTGEGICMPVPLKNVSQVLVVALESEAHGQITAPQPYTTTVPGTIVRTTDKESQYRIAFTNRYNAGYLVNSDQKVLIPNNPNEVVTNRYPARSVFSDQKVYNTDIQGFDLFPVANFVDLEEAYGGITKLALVGDNLFGLQERGIAMIPVDASTLSTTDAQTISVRSGTTDIPIYVSRINGTQHMKAVQVLSEKIIFPDNRTGQVFVLGGQELRPISEEGAINRMKQKIGSTLVANQLFSMYDEVKRQYFLFKPDSFCVVWDDRLGVWQDQLELSSGTNKFYGGVRVNNILYGLGRDGTALKVSTMYTGSPNQFWGATVVPRVKFVVNQDYEHNKVFDNLIAYSTDPLSTADISGERETGATGFDVTGMTFDVDRREGYYIIPILRDSNGARVRSTRADVTIKWPNSIISLSEIITKYRLSSRYPHI